MSKKLIGIAVVAIMLFGVLGLAGCDNVSLADYKVTGKASIDAHASLKALSDNWAVVCSIVDNGETAVDEAATKPQVDDVVEKTKEDIDMEVFAVEVNNMVDCNNFLYHAARSSIGYPITLIYENSDSIFECIVDKGVFALSEEPKKTCAVKSEGGLFWYPDEDGIEKAYIDVVLKVNEEIIGYAVIEIYANDSVGITYKAKSLIAVLFPKIDGQYQSITQEHVNIKINKIKR